MTDFTKLMEYRFQGVKKYNTYISILWSLKFVEKLGAQHDIEILFQSLCHLYDSTLPAKQFRKSENVISGFSWGGGGNKIHIYNIILICIFSTSHFMTPYSRVIHRLPKKELFLRVHGPIFKHFVILISQVSSYFS